MVVFTEYEFLKKFSLDDVGKVFAFYPHYCGGCVDNDFLSCSYEPVADTMNCLLCTSNYLHSTEHKNDGLINKILNKNTMRIDD